jgi:hypothetical protein
VSTLRIGITGHRVIEDSHEVERELRRARTLAVAAGLTPDPAARGLPGGPESVHLQVLSALAEGGDRLAARVLLEEPRASLVAVLPLQKDDYLSDFGSQASKEEFLELLARAERVEVVAASASREEGYERAGRRIVEESDLLFALWDGLASRGRGGTADIVEYARSAEVPVYWIRTNGASVTLVLL